VEKGQGLCPWTPWGFETPNPQFQGNVFQRLAFDGATRLYLKTKSSVSKKRARTAT
jgi:hypothetical protein